MHDSSYEDSEFEFQTDVKRASTLERESSLVDYDESPHFPRQGYYNGHVMRAFFKNIPKISQYGVFLFKYQQTFGLVC